MSVAATLWVVGLMASVSHVLSGEPFWETHRHAGRLTRRGSIGVFLIPLEMRLSLLLGLRPRHDGF